MRVKISSISHMAEFNCKCNKYQNSHKNLRFEKEKDTRNIFTLRKTTRCKLGYSIKCEI